MALDRQFEVVRPDLSRLVRTPLEVANLGLINPLSTSPYALIDGELVSISGGKWTRATVATSPTFFVIEDRGSTGVQASRKLSAITGGGGFLANTVIFNAGLTSENAAVMWGAVTLESVARSGLIAHTGTNIVMGYVMKPAASNGGKLQVFVTFN